MSNNNSNSITVINMTNFFNRELIMYSLGDIKFKKPVSLKKIAYTTAFLILWSGPIIFLFGIQLNVVYAAIVLGPPILLGNFGARPLFGGRSLLDFTKTSLNFLREPKGWTDLRASKKLNKETFFVESEIWISRRRELQLLADLKGKGR